MPTTTARIRRTTASLAGRVPICCVVASLLSVAPAAAQPAGAPFARATGLSLALGATRADGETSLTAGGAVLWTVQRRLAIEGSGRWIDQPDAASGFAADLMAHFRFVEAGERTVPYLGVGAGLYRATFRDLTGANVDRLPAFYRDRLDVSSVSSRTSFTDPTFAIGAGVDVRASRQWRLRPDVRLLVARAEGASLTTVVATVSLGYTFERRPVTP